MKSKTTRLAKTFAAASLAGVLAFGLTGCDPYGIEEASRTSEAPKSTEPEGYQLDRIAGDTWSDPDAVVIICVRGSAFLYVMSDGYQRGGPSIARFAEQDFTCTGDGDTKTPISSAPKGDSE